MSLNYAVSAYDNVSADVTEASYAGSITYTRIIAYNYIVPENDLSAELDILANHYTFTCFRCGHCLFSSSVMWLCEV